MKYDKDKHRPIDGVENSPMEPPFIGSWVPVSIAAYISDYNRQTIWLWTVNNLIRSVRYPAGPLLVSMEDIYKMHVYTPSDDVYEERRG